MVSYEKDFTKLGRDHLVIVSLKEGRKVMIYAVSKENSEQQKGGEDAF